MKRIYLLASFLLFFGSGLLAQTAGQIRLVEFVRGLSSPVDIQHAGDGSDRLFVLEQRGRIRIIRNGALVTTPFLDIISRVRCCGEQGLLGLAFPPGYKNKNYFYLNYTNGSGHTVIARYRVTGNPDIADASSETILLTINQPYANHNGGQIVFGPDGYLYIGMGDGGSAGDPQNNGQNPAALLGKMLRIDVESGDSPYRVPGDNPFVSSPAHRGEIWAMGLRNPWRFSFDRQTGDMYIGDVGQNLYEEVHFQPASSTGGENYGWNLMEGLHTFRSGSQTGLTLPVVEYGRSGGCSVTGGFVYRGSRFPSLQGVYIYADYCRGNIWGLERDAGAWRNSLLLDTSLGISTFGEDESGNLFLADHSAGRIYLVAGGPPAFTSSAVVNAASFVGGVVPGSIATLFGSGITNLNGIAQAQAYPLPRTLNSISVRVNGLLAPLYAVANVNGREQINWQVPEELAGASTANLVVINNGVESAPVEVSVNASQPGIFTMDGLNAAVLHASNSQLVSAQNPAGKGEEVSIYATGLGAVDRPPGTGNAASASLLARTVMLPLVTIGGRAAEVRFSGLAPTFAGLYQINVRVPADAPSGSVDLQIGNSPPAKIALR